MAVSKKTEEIEIKPIAMQKIKVTVVGDSALIMHAWSEKAKGMLRDPKTSKMMKGRPRTPVDDYVQSMYWLEGKPEYDALNPPDDDTIRAMVAKAKEEGCKFGFPITAFKQAAISAAYRQGWVKDKMSLRGAFFLETEYDDMVEIVSDFPEIREDMVRIGMGTADIRYRGEFNNWSATFTLKYNKNGKYSLDDILNILNAGGFVCGVGEWRPERDGQFGMFHVEDYTLID